MTWLDLWLVSHLHAATMPNLPPRIEAGTHASKRGWVTVTDSTITVWTCDTLSTPPPPRKP